MLVLLHNSWIRALSILHNSSMLWVRAVGIFYSRCILTNGFNAIIDIPLNRCHCSFYCSFYELWSLIQIIILVECPIGKEVTPDGKFCMDCQTGTYRSNLNVTYCVACPGNQTTKLPGATSSADCKGMVPLREFRSDCFLTEVNDDINRPDLWAYLKVDYIDSEFFDSDW